MIKYKFSEKDYPIKGYFHFDYPIHISEVESYVQNPKKIADHSFFPLIGYEQKREKYIGNLPEFEDGRPFISNPRPIKYAGHLDGYIYKYYANQLNYAYNQWVCDYGVDGSSIAYRTNKKGKSNIDFAAEVINYIAQQEKAYIIVGDFKSYFDSLNHYLLKKRMYDVLSIEHLPDDWYNVFKSVTKYGHIEKTQVEDFFGHEGLLRQQGFKKFTSKEKPFCDFRKSYKIKGNTKKGIPQGVPISAVMANVYAIKFDEQINRIVEGHKGLYRRYSDDFIIVIPQNFISKQQFNKVVDTVFEAAAENELTIAKDKTDCYEKIGKDITGLGQNSSAKLDYLGFVYNGKTVTIRQKSIERFYRRMRKMVKTMQRKKNKNNRKAKKPVMKKIPHRDRIYGLFTDKGFKRKNGRGKSNFIEYVKRSQIIFDKVSKETDNLMLDQIKNRKKKLENLLGDRIYVKQVEK